MCGRYVLDADEATFRKEFDAIIENIQRKSQAAENAGNAEKDANELTKKRFNIAPSQMVAAVRQFENERIISTLKWGFVPSWSKDATIANKMINARAETLSEKASFKSAYRARRCVIAASGFYEWQKLRETTNDKTAAKQPFYFYVKERPVFGFAGLWEGWTNEKTGEKLETCAIITTTANALLSQVHERMPVILRREDYETWLDPKEKNTEKLQSLLAPYSADEMASHAVARTVNSPKADSGELIAKLISQTPNSL